MKKVNNILKDNERIIYRARLHWGMLLGPIIVVFFGYLMIGSKGPQVIAVFAFGLIWGLFAYINLHISEIVLTDNRLLINVGFPIKKFFDIPLIDITHFDFYQPSLGTMLNFGKIILVKKDKKKKAFRFIDSPAVLVQEVHKQAMVVRGNEKPAAKTVKKTKIK
ncbi:MAG: PH domain-containing protein [Spirochaetes bacterium]|nr:PH domain-containing protein [Spirochaetota bacterium]